MERDKLHQQEIVTFTPEKINGSFFNKDILSLDQFDKDSLGYIFDITPRMRDIAINAREDKTLSGILATLLFYEPSSRTRGSFDASIKQLGGNTIVVENPQQFSSVSKGETFEDTVRTFESYTDLIVLRHPNVGSANIAADTAKHVPVINAGDGVGEHPTQALLDLFTIKEHAGKLSNTIGVVGGDIKNGRTIHSLLRGLCLFEGNEINVISPLELGLTPREVEYFESRGIKINILESMEQIPKEADFWYWTRVQKERFEDINQYKKLKNSYIVTEENFNRLAGKNTALMHPLPRVGEIDNTLDQDSRSLYLRSQIRNGMYIRMALSALVLGRIK